MSLKDQLREEVRAESQKLKDMSFQDKLWYIWEYYKIHIGGVVLAFLLISVVVTSVRNISIHPGLCCVPQQPLFPGHGYLHPGTGFP